MHCLLLFIVFLQHNHLVKNASYFAHYISRLKIVSSPRAVLRGMITMLFRIPLFLSCFYGVPMFAL